ncbi:hypothetical protein PV332_14475 [Streptomyces scabiei]|uniref:hypothetical protein n=1 Tax=Streptomyces scabiei TaxID=1930 RepID=UPI0029A10E5A|nr:hypothetical protein [Streptomyces scabiei]MDX2576675.1 hypothetical protein [Streptomyces scabiei]MDX3027643.1 hypothetical protein [Streptomyces scabiei]MDX3206310.1 hypothetical protein [Streptomyces scabiei]
MPQLLQNLTLLAALVALAAIAVTAIAVGAGDELTEHQARVLCVVMKAVEHVAIAYGATLAAQDTPLTLVVKAVMPLLR